MMKKNTILLTMLFMMCSLSYVYADVNVEVGVFYDQLAPYGDWIYLDNYGVWVWRPVGLWAGWQPYTYGRWEWSEEYGWIWVSYFEWGWAPFHYGRWFYDGYYGWVWVPGTVWRPHWVVWIHNGPYIGWYPYYPSFVYIDYYSPVVYERWVVIESSNISSGNYHHYVLPSDKRAEVLNNKSGAHKYIPKEDDESYHNYGPPKSEIEKSINRKIEPIKPEFTNKPENIYRPNERKFVVYKPEFKSKLPDIGYIQNRNIPKNPVNNLENQPVKRIPSNLNSEFKPKYTAPLGKYQTFERGYEGNSSSFKGYDKGVMHGSGGPQYNYNSQNFDYKSGVHHSDGKILREESVKSYSPDKGKGFYVPKSDSDDSDDDDSNYKKSIPKFSPKGSTVPKSAPQFKGK